METKKQATCNTCGDKDCSATKKKKDESDQDFLDRQQLQSRLCRIGKKIVVLSGKGGVGKSTVAVNIATALTMAGKRVGLLDIDIHGPSIPTMLGFEGTSALGSEEGLLPVDLGGMKVMSIGFLLNSQDDAVIWRGPMKWNVIKQFLKDVVWGDLDYLIVDSPPGTGDEPLSVIQLIGEVDGAVIVTTPQKVAEVDVRKSISFCKTLHVPVIGVVENMSGFACPKCGEVTQILRSGGGKRLSEAMGVPFLGAIPIDPKIAEACDDGRMFLQYYAESPTAGIMREIIRPIVGSDSDDMPLKADETAVTERGKPMKIAIPVANGLLAMHFGHCEHFALVDVNTVGKKIIGRKDIEAPPHEPGLLPPWLAERGVTTIIAGGMGERAQGLFAENGIQVMVGAPAETPEKLVADYLDGTLKTGDNVCDH